MVGYFFMILCYLVLGESTQYSYTGSPVVVTLMRGVYLFECWGAQGGTGCKDGSYAFAGGKGAYTSGIIYLSNECNFYLYIGGVGKSPKCVKNTIADGGWNGGGAGGEDYNDDDSSGSGGGATDIRITIDDIFSRIMVAAGGSGSAFGSYGAPGGALFGLRKTSASINDVAASSTNQTNGHALGQGQNGARFFYIPSSGAGGGYYGGYSSSGYQLAADSHLAVSNSGSSFISGHPQCNSVSSSGSHTGSPNHYSGFIFFNTSMKSGVESMVTPTGSGSMIGNSGNGAVRITFVKDYILKTSPDRQRKIGSFILLANILFLFFGVC